MRRHERTGIHLTFEQVEACKTLAHYAAGLLGEPEAKSVLEMLEEKDPLYYPLWINRNRFWNQIDEILDSTGARDELYD